MARKKEISLLNVAFMLAVILLHLCSDAITRLDPASAQYAVAFVPWKLASAAVTGFIFLSGLRQFLSGGSFSYRRFYLRRLKTIVLPYLIAVAIYWITLHFAYGFEFSWDKIVDYFVLGRLASHFYFIVVLVQLYALMPLWRAMVRRVSPLIGIPAAILAMLLFRECLRVLLARLAPDYALQYQDRFFMSYVAFWVAGCYCGADYERFKALVRRSGGFILGLFCVCALANLYFPWLKAAKGVDFAYFSALQAAYGFSAILAAYWAALKRCERKSESRALLRRLDAESYYIYLYHMLVLLLANKLIEYLGVTGVAPAFCLRAAMVCGVTLGAALLWRGLKERGPAKP